MTMMKLFISTVVIVAVVLAGEVKAQGTGSVVRGDSNKAKGILCTVGGGEDNSAGPKDTIYSTVGGGKENSSDGNQGVISGGNGNLIFAKDEDNDLFSSINGGVDNLIDKTEFSVITGGNNNTIRQQPVLIPSVGTEQGTVSGGNSNNILNGRGNVITGGDGNTLNSITDSVITGGKSNKVDRDNAFGAVVVGGLNNEASGVFSIAFGTNAFADTANSMATNLSGNSAGKINPIRTTSPGQFLIQAKSYKFQIGNGKNNNGDVSSTILSKDNIQKLISALEF